MKNYSQICQKYLWILFLALGLLGFLFIWFVLPHKSEIDHPWQMYFKILIFIFITMSIAFYPNKSTHNFLLLLIPFIGFTGYIIPRLSYFGFSGAAINQGMGGEFYTILYLITFPAILLTTCLAYRFGGGSPGNTIKISLSGVILLFSGFLDILWYLVNPVKIPEIIQYAHHIQVILGHYPSYTETIIFALCHLPLLVVILLLPLDRWFDKILDSNQPISTKQKTGVDK